MSGIPVWWDGVADGPTNMAADECLVAEAVRHGGLVIRLYGWDATAVSLGAFQRIADARDCDAIAGVPIVRRPSGGGAIVHGSDLTYAAAVPKGHPWGSSPQALYDALHGAMVDVLRDRGINARLAVPGDGLPGKPSQFGASVPFLCFDRRSPGDVVVDRERSDGRHETFKLMGSAQRRLDAAVLQHGSLLVSRNTDVDMTASHPGLREVAADDWADDGAVRECAVLWISRVAAAIGQAVNEQPDPFFSGDRPDFVSARDRFAADRWTSRR